MKALILLILPAVLLAQLPKPGNGGGGGGSGSGSSNPNCTFASSATTCSIDVSSLNVTTANYKSILAECFTGASTTQTPVSITSYAYTTGSGIVQTVAPTFGAAAAAGYCAANGNGGAGPTGPAGGAGPTGSTGATGPGYGGTSTSAVSIGSGLKAFTTQSGLAYLVGVPIRATSSGAPTSFMQGVVNSYSGTSLVIDVSETGGVGSRADWNLSLIGIDGTAGANGTNGTGYTATTTTSVTVSTGSKTVTTQAGLAYVVGSLVKIVSAATPANYVQGLATSYSGTSLTVNATETGGSGSFTDGNITIAGSTGAQGPAGTGGGGAVYASDTSVTPNLITITPSPAITYTDGVQVLVRVNNDSTGAVNINANGLGNIPVTTTTGLAMYTDAFKHDGVYLFAYKGGAFQLMGSGACIQVSSGLSCGPGWLTMRGTTGYRVYNTEVTGANDSVNIVGYLQGFVPTSGNCAQWSTDGGQPILGQAAAPCGSGGGGGSINTQLDGSTIGTGITALNIQTTPDVAPTMSQSTGTTNASFSIVSTKWATRDQIQSGTDDYCSPVSGSSSAYTCTHAHPLAAYTAGQTQTMRFDVGGSGGAITVNMDSLGAKKIFGPDGTTALTTTQSAAGVQGLMIYDGAVDSGSGGWKFQTGGTSTSSSGITYAADTGTANALVVTPSPAITYTAGTALIVKVLNANTGATTINANGLGTKNVTTTLIASLPSGTLSAGGTYLIVYDGTQFQLQGTANCAMTATGISCASASNSSLTMGGSTSGATTYVAPAVGASATYRLTGYSSATNPTAGNCMQWTSLSGNLVAGDAGAACGSGGGSPVTAVYRPFGGLDPGLASYTTNPGTNVVWYFQVLIPSPGIVLNRLNAFAASGSAHAAWGVYNSSCSKIADSSLTASGQAFMSFPFSAVSLTAGTYYFAVSADGAMPFFMSNADGSGYGAGMANQGESSTTYKVFAGSNASTTVGSTTTLPTTCGTRTVLGDVSSITSVKIIPAISIQ